MVGFVAYFIIQQQKDYPQKISTYILQNTDMDSDEECREAAESPDSGGLLGEYCTKTLRLNYKNSDDNSGVFVILTKFTKGDDVMLEAFKKFSRLDKNINPSLLRAEKAEIGWFSEKKYDFVMIQEYIEKINGSGVSYDYSGLATGNNDVVRWFLEKYPIDESRMNKIPEL